MANVFTAKLPSFYCDLFLFLVRRGYTRGHSARQSNREKNTIDYNHTIKEFKNVMGAIHKGNMVIWTLWILSDASSQTALITVRLRSAPGNDWVFERATSPQQLRPFVCKKQRKPNWMQLVPFPKKSHARQLDTHTTQRVGDTGKAFVKVYLSQVKQWQCRKLACIPPKC